MLTQDVISFELRGAAIDGVRDLDSLRKYFMNRNDTRMVRWVNKHPLTAVRTLNEKIQA